MSIRALPILVVLALVAGVACGGGDSSATADPTEPVSLSCREFSERIERAYHDWHLASLQRAQDDSIGARHRVIRARAARDRALPDALALTGWDPYRITAGTLFVDIARHYGVDAPRTVATDASSGRGLIQTDVSGLFGQWLRAVIAASAGPRASRAFDTFAKERTDYARSEVLNLTRGVFEVGNEIIIPLCAA